MNKLIRVTAGRRRPAKIAWVMALTTLLVAIFLMDNPPDCGPRAYFCDSPEVNEFNIWRIVLPLASTAVAFVISFWEVLRHPPED